MNMIRESALEQKALKLAALCGEQADRIAELEKENEKLRGEKAPKYCPNCGAKVIIGDGDE